MDSKLSFISTKLFEAKISKKLTFADIGNQLGRNEVWVAAVFYGQAKPEESDLKKLSELLDIPEKYLLTDFNDETYFPSRGRLFDLPPSDPLLYRFYEILQVYGYPLKSVINEKFGDGIMSAIDFTTNVEKTGENQERVKITFEGKFLPFKKW
ncbi:9578_t:CDS:2 [Diversispora eburnea]|uniref:Cyanate hydratase n=1 Tax=Diversispora eburnea TaxID=1213867 RepID=A0A9N8V006_9GLOM|nr:9578_t:CDS:2 [Diversispora eburnea]